MEYWRAIWLHVRAGIAWGLFRWGVAAFHREDPQQYAVAKALLPLCERELAKLKGLRRLAPDAKE